MTPEPKEGAATSVTSAQEAAVDAVAALLPTAQKRAWAAEIIDALLSPTKKPCAECGGKLFVPAVPGEEGARKLDLLVWAKPCPDCIDGFVSSPAPIEGLLERPSHVNVFEAGGTLVRLMPVAEPLFRLPSKVREG